VPVATIFFVDIVGMLCWRTLILRRSGEIRSINVRFVRTTMTSRLLRATVDTGPSDDPSPQDTFAEGKSALPLGHDSTALSNGF
jgi:hypothetical protein